MIAIDQLLAPEPRARVEEFQRRHRIGLLTLLFTDMVDSTRLKQDLGDLPAVALLQDHHARLREALRQFPEGEEIGTAGDSFLIVFARPSDAVRFALLAQAAVRTLARASGARLMDRIGIHVGEVIIEQTRRADRSIDLFGLQVDTCARLMALGRGDQVLMSRVVFDNARQALKGLEIPGIGGLAWLNHGPYLLKGVEEPLEVCEVGEAGLAVLEPPRDSDKAHRQVSPDGEPVLGWRPALEVAVPGTEWVLQEKLGEGGFGEVWLGRHRITKERRVFKFCFRADRVRSLKREVTLFRLLRERVGDHPHIIGLREVYFDEPPYYLEMDYAEGRDLRAWCAAQGGVDRVPLPLRLEVVAQMADALHVAHQAGVIHRDVKPSNILVADRPPPGRPPEDEAGTAAPAGVAAKLTDFGIGQVVSEEILADMTRSGFTQTLVTTGSSQSGTQMYMAPELLAGKPASPRSDLYSLGVVLYQLVVGDFNRPVAVDWAREVADPLLREDLGRCFAGAPEDRFASAAELAQALRSLPRRQKALAEQEALVAAREKAAYRRGVAKTASVAVLIAAVFALLAGYALKKARDAKALAIQAERSAQAEARQRERAEDALNRNEIQKAEELFAAGNARGALACLARVLRHSPTNRVAAERLLSALSQRNYALPLFPPLTSTSRIVLAEYTADGRQMVTLAADGTLGRVDARSGESQTSGRLSDTNLPNARPTSEGNPFGSASLSADGQRVTTLRQDTAQVWDIATARPVTPPLRHDSTVDSAQVGPDGQGLVSVDMSDSAQLWRNLDGQWTAQPLKHDGQVTSAQYSPDGARILTTARDKTARLWDARTGQLLSGLPHQGDPTDAAFSPDGLRVVTACMDETACIWDVRSGAHARRPPLHHEGWVAKALFSPDGGRIATGSADKTARIWDAQTAQPLTRPLPHTDVVQFLRFSPDGMRLVTGAWDGTVRVWDAATGRLLVETFELDAALGSARFDQEGHRLLTLSDSGTLCVWELQLGRMLAEPLRHQSKVLHAQFSADGQRILTAAGDKTARVWDALQGRPMTERLLHDRLPLFHDFMDGIVRLPAQFSPDGRQAVTAYNETARLWDLDSGQVRGPAMAHRGQIITAQFSPDGHRVLTASWDGTARIWDAGSGQALGQPMPHRSWVNFAQFSPDGGRVVTVSDDQSARIWDGLTGQPLTPPLVHPSFPKSAQFSADGRWIVTACWDGAARVWDGTTGKLREFSLRHEGPIMYAEFSPDGRTLATAARDKTARVWDASTGQPLTSPLQHADLVKSARFSPDGRRLVTASLDRTVRLWDAQTGQPLAEPMVHEAGVAWAAFSPDGRWLVSASRDRTARVQEVLPSELAVPPWLPGLAEAIAGRRMDERGLTAVVPPEVAARLRRDRPGTAGADASARWARWFFAEPGARTLSPSCPILLTDYVARRIDENSLPSLHEAVLLSPTNSVAFARLAALVKDQDPKDNPGRLEEAGFYARHALKHDPDSAEAKRILEALKPVNGQ